MELQHGFTVKQFIDFLTNNPLICLDYRPLSACSWRGIYSEPCIIFTLGESIGSDWLRFLYEIAYSGNTYYGWKGGEYVYCENDTINFEFAKGLYTPDHENTVKIFGDYIKDGIRLVANN